MEKTKSRLKILTVLFVVGVSIIYLLQISPSPVLSFIRDDYNLFNKDAMLNMSMSIIFPFCIVFCAVGTWIEQRVGTVKLYVIALTFTALSALMLPFVTSYSMYLASRVIYAIGFGLTIPFCGSAIMRWYSPKQREVMNTINGVFPWIGVLGAFLLLVPMTEGFGGSWRMAICFWGILSAAVLILWLIFVNNKSVTVYEEQEKEEQRAVEKGIYRNLWKRKEMKLLCGSFICDFFFYSYISALLPLFLMEAGQLTEASASMMAAFAFPAVGIVGTIGGGVVASKSGRRRPVMLTGQALKVIGTIFMVLTINISVWLALVGVVCFTIGNSSWLPAFYMVPMELEDMNPSRAAGAFSLMLSSGFVAGSISPVLGGWITTMLAGVSGIQDPIMAHVFGLKWSFFIFGFVNVLAFICIWFLRETGPNRIRR